MVYCGKPSRGCQMCRSRRIKCDEGRPTCLQCKKSRRPCPGYKDDFDLVFRNETQATERRAQRSIDIKKLSTRVVGQDDSQHQRTRSNSIETNLHFLDASSPTGISSNIFLSVPESLVIPVELRAQHHFMSNFILLPRPGTGRGFLDYVIPLISSDHPAPHLLLAFGAVALASMGNRPNAKRLLFSANEQYNRALRYVNEALRDPVAQKTDATLASVLLLGLFEVITSRRTNITAWGSHIEGAVMLVKMRGKKQLRTKIGYSLFNAVRTQMIINCTSASKAPDLGLDWWLVDSAKDRVFHEVTKLNIQVVELRAEVNRVMTIMPRNPENLAKVLGLMSRCQTLDREFLEWVENVPDDWRYETVAWVEELPDSDVAQADVCPGRIDVYSDIFIANVWNMMRISRLFLGGMVVRCAAWACAPIDYRTTPEYTSSARLGSDMITDICASLPFSLGWTLPGDGRRASLVSHSRNPCGDDGSEGAKALGGYLANWPLFTCCCSDFASDTQRKWMLGRMRYISETLGLDQASTFAHYQLRLPSMIVKRDGLGLSTPDPKALAGCGPTAGLPVPAFPAPPVPSRETSPAGSTDSASITSRVQVFYQQVQQDDARTESANEDLTREASEPQFLKHSESFEREHTLLNQAVVGDFRASKSMENVIRMYMKPGTVSSGM